jgi:mono/diheme cytochrome c family protein
MFFMNRVVAFAAVLILAATVAHSQDRSATTTAPPSVADPAVGEQLFASTCGFCHQDGGRVAGRGPKLAGTDRPDAYLINRIRTGKEGAMPAYGRALSEGQLRSLLAYIRSLKDEGR